MKKTHLLITFLLLITTVINAQNQTDTLVVLKKYARSKKLPLKIGPGTFVINKADTLYLVNQIRFNYYQELRELVKTDVGKDIENIVLKYEKIVKENDFLFDQLAEKNKQQTALYLNTIANLKTSLNETDRTLSLSQKSLKNANTAIALSLQQISSAQKKQIWKNLGLIGGGVSIGLIAGLLLVN